MPKSSESRSARLSIASFARRGACTRRSARRRSSARASLQPLVLFHDRRHTASTAPGRVEVGQPGQRSAQLLERPGQVLGALGRDAADQLDLADIEQRRVGDLAQPFKPVQALGAGLHASSRA